MTINKQLQTLRKLVKYLTFGVLKADNTCPSKQNNTGNMKQKQVVSGICACTPRCTHIHANMYTNQSKHSRRMRSIGKQFHLSGCIHFFSCHLGHILDKKELKQGVGAFWLMAWGYSSSWPGRHGAEAALSCDNRNMNETSQASQGQGAGPDYKSQGWWVPQQPTSSRKASPPEVPQPSKTEPPAVDRVLNKWSCGNSLCVTQQWFSV